MVVGKSWKKRSLDHVKFENLDPGDAEIIDPDPDLGLDGTAREAKRRRVEFCARKYLRGHSLYISSAVIIGQTMRRWGTSRLRDYQTSGLEGTLFGGKIEEDLCQDTRQDIQETDGVSEEGLSGVVLERNRACCSLVVKPDKKRDGSCKKVKPRGNVVVKADPQVDQERSLDQPKSSAIPSLGRPLSPSSSSRYTHQWLRQQNFLDRTPSPESENVTQISIASPQITPSKPERASTSKKPYRQRRSLSRAKSSTLSEYRPYAAGASSVVQDDRPTTDYISTILRDSPESARHNATGDESDSLPDFSGPVNIIGHSLEVNVDSSLPLDSTANPESALELIARENKRMRDLSDTLGCVSCIKRRVKCDRKVRCGNCSKREDHCGYDPHYAISIRAEKEQHGSNLKEAIRKVSLDVPQHLNGFTPINADIATHLSIEKRLVAAPVAALAKGRHPDLASPVVASNSPGFPFRRVAPKGKLQETRFLPFATWVNDESPADAAPIDETPDNGILNDGVVHDEIQEDDASYGPAPQAARPVLTGNETFKLLVQPNSQGRWPCPISGCRWKCRNGEIPKTKSTLDKHVKKDHKLATTSTRTNAAWSSAIAAFIVPIAASLRQLAVGNRPLDTTGPNKNISRAQSVAGGPLSRTGLDSPLGDRTTSERTDLSASGTSDGHIPPKHLSKYRPTMRKEVSRQSIADLLNPADVDALPAPVSPKVPTAAEDIPSDLQIANELSTVGQDQLVEQGNAPPVQPMGHMLSHPLDDPHPSQQDLELNTVDTGTTIPNHQNSRAYSSVNFDAMQPTQAALEKYTLAFQETQSPEHNFKWPHQDENRQPEEQDGARIERIGDTTPFRDLNSQPGSVRGILFAAVPESTQDLHAAAQRLTFSTAKKPRQNKQIISNWPIRKPLQLSQPASTKDMITDFPPYSQSYPSKQSGSIRPSPFAASFQNRSSSVLSEAATKPAAAAIASHNNKPAPLASHTTPLASVSMSLVLPFSASAPSPVVVPSFQEAQVVSNVYPGSEPSMDSQEIENVLDDLSSFLASGTVENDVRATTRSRKSLGSSPWTAVNR